MINSYSPIIISASRATDIPAFYGDWLIQRISDGYVIKKNPYNGKYYRINFDNTQLMVFWTKDAKPFINKIDHLSEQYPNYYFQYTLNSYNKTIEINLPCINQRIETFIELSEKIGKEKIIWRFDPLILTDFIHPEDLIKKIEFVAEKIHKYTKKLVVSFIDINNYRKVKKINQISFKYYEFTTEKKTEFAKLLTELNKKYKLELATCAKEIILSGYNIKKNKCIDDELIRKLFNENKILTDYVNDPKNLKDTGQRKECGCIKSKDIGQYNTCIHSCVYCYAVSSRTLAYKNYKNRLKKI